jgi:hypothetical protein
MSGKDLRIVGQRQELFMKAPVEHGSELLRGMSCGQVGPAHVAYEQRISREDGLRALGLAQIRHQNADALCGMAGGLQKPQAALPELKLVSVLDGDVGELRAGAGSNVDTRTGAFRQFMMAGNEIGMQVCFNDVLNLPCVSSRRVQIKINVSLGIDDRGNAFRTDRVRCVCQATQIEPLDPYRFHAALRWTNL